MFAMVYRHSHKIIQYIDLLYTTCLQVSGTQFLDLFSFALLTHFLFLHRVVEGNVYFGNQIPLCNTFIDSIRPIEIIE